MARLARLVIPALGGDDEVRDRCLVTYEEGSPTECKYVFTIVFASKIVLYGTVGQKF